MSRVLLYRVDDTAVREEHERLIAEYKFLEQGLRAARALRWLKKYVLPEWQANEVLDPNVTVSVGAEREDFQHYVTRAAEKAIPDIMRDAVALAHADFNRSEQRRRAAERDFQRQISEQRRREHEKRNPKPEGDTAT
jgi:hypothetical protein